MLASLVDENNIVINIMEVNNYSDYLKKYNEWDKVGEEYSDVEPVKEVEEE